MAIRSGGRGYGHTARSAIGLANPATLFAGGVKGIVLDPYAPASMWTDTGGTVQAAANDAIARIDDLSGNGANATQSTAAKPVLIHDGTKRALRFTSDSLATAAIDMTGTDAVTVVAAVRKTSDAAVGGIVEFSPNVSTNNGSFALLGPANAGGSVSFNFNSKGTTLASPGVTSLPATIDAVIVAQSDISADTATINVNGSTGSSAGDQGTGNFGNHVLYIGVRAGTLFFSGDIYGLIVLGRTATASEVRAMQAWAYKRMLGDV